MFSNLPYATTSRRYVGCPAETACEVHYCVNAADGQSKQCFPMAIAVNGVPGMRLRHRIREWRPELFPEVGMPQVSEGYQK